MTTPPETPPQDPSGSEPPRAGSAPLRSDARRADNAGRAARDDAGSAEAVPGRAGSGGAVSGGAVPGDAVSGGAVPGDAGSGDARSGDAGPGAAAPGVGGSTDTTSVGAATGSVGLDPALPETEPHGIDAPRDEATFSRILEPRSSGRLPLGDGTWHQLARAYVRVQLISQGAVFLLVLAAALVAQMLTGVAWQWIPAGVILLVTAIGLVITPRQARSFGYQLRHDDLVFRRGILWQRVVAVPYGRMQLVDITHGPLDRGFGIAQLKLVTAAASTGVTIPGLTQEGAERLRDTLVAVAETRRTGL